MKKIEKKTTKKEITLDDVVKRVDVLSDKIDIVAVSVEDLTVTVGTLTKNLYNLTVTVDTLTTNLDNLAVTVDKLATMTVKGFSDLEERLTDKIEKEVKEIKEELKTKASKADILELHDKFIHRREFDQLALRVSKVEEKKRK